MKMTQKGLMLTVGIITLLIAGGLVGVAWWYESHSNEAPTNIGVGASSCREFEVWCENKQKCIVPGGDQCSDLATEDFITELSAGPAGPDGILYITEGDIWKSDGSGNNKLKLVDRDRVVEAAYSSDQELLAYSEIVPTIESVTNPDGSIEQLEMKDEYNAPRTLFLANKLGGDSITVKKNIRRWGWVPNSQLLWYETSSLRQVFDWGFHGDNNIWIYNTQSRRAEVIVQSQNTKWSIPTYVLGPKWSPDGNKVAFVTDILDDDNDFSTRVLRVVDRLTRKSRDLLLLPWVGGDRGGPAPIPDIFWGPTNENIYTGFTPIVDATDDKNTEYSSLLKSGYVSILKIAINGSGVKEVVPKEPSFVFTEESSVRLTFDTDFKKVLYYSAVLDKSVDTNKPYDWIYGHEGSATKRVKIIDIESGQTWIVNDDSNQSNIQLRTYDDTLGTYIGDKYAFVLHNAVIGNDTWFVIDKIYFNNSNKEEWLKVPAFGGSNVGFFDVSYHPEIDSFYFRVNDTLYKAQHDSLSVVLKGVTDVVYY